jgi:RNA polymerase sigma-70 factor (ECF subfamily)
MAGTAGLAAPAWAPPAQSPRPQPPSRDALSSHRMPADAHPGDLETVLRPLWLRAQAGDEAAYRQALGLLAGRLRAYLRRRLARWPDEVEDLVQETLLALHLQRGTWVAALPVSAWAVAIARHKLVDLWRRQGRRDDLHDAIDDVDEQLLVSEPDDGGARRDLEGLLRELPAAQQQAIVLTKLEGLSVAEAASRTGASESAIKVQVHRGLKRLAALVRREPGP